MSLGNPSPLSPNQNLIGNETLAIRKVTPQDFGKSILPPCNHNSVSGAHTMLEIAGISSFTGLPMVNRIFSPGSTIAPLLASSTCNFGSVDYNSSTGVCAFGSNNNTSISPRWSAREVEKSFAVPSGHSSRNSGVDVGQTFTADGTQYGALPGMTQPGTFPRYYLTDNPDRGWLPRSPFRMGGYFLE